MGLDKILNINKNLLKRIYTLLFLIPIYFFSIISSSYLSTAVILLTSLILSFEWFEITQEDKGRKNFILFSFLVFLNLFFFIINKFFFFINFNNYFFFFYFITNFF